MTDFADDNLKLEENGRKLLKPVENTVGKGEVAHYEQFLLFPQCFQMVSLCGKGLKGFFPEPLTRYQTTNFRPFQMKKRFADDNFKFGKNGRKLSKWLENTVGKGEIARNEQFLLFPQCFQKACFPGASKVVTEWEWVN